MTVGENIAANWSDRLDAQDIKDLAWWIDETMKAQISEIERLRTALKPFAEEYEGTQYADCDEEILTHPHGDVTYADFYQARKALMRV